MTSYGAGQIHHWEGGSLWIGRATAANAVHAHHAVQVALALEGRFQFQSPEDGVWLDCAGAVIASNRPHAFAGRNAPALAHIFVEPVSLAGRVLLRRFPSVNGIAVLHGSVRSHPQAGIAASFNPRPSRVIYSSRQHGSYPKHEDSDMSTQPNTCTCLTCPGSSCTCGCQAARLELRTGCRCGKACTCGPTCGCPAA